MIMTNLSLLTKKTNLKKTDSFYWVDKQLPTKLFLKRAWVSSLVLNKIRRSKILMTKIAEDKIIIKHYRLKLKYYKINLLWYLG